MTQGPALVHLPDQKGARPSAAHELLARRFCVIVLDTPAGEPAAPAQAVTERRLERFDLWATAASAETAVRLALEMPEQVRSLVLEAPAATPAGTDLETRLRSLPMPTLVVLGTRGDISASAPGRTYRDLVPNAHLVLVYEAGPAPAADRPEAFVEVVGDFLERHEAFVINRAATVIHP